MDKKEVLLEIKKIFKILNKKHRNCTLTSNEVHDLYIEYLKLSTMLDTNNPLYKNDIHDYKRGNCYCYALGLKFPYKFYYHYNSLSEDPFVHNIGFISKSNDAFCKDEIMDNFYKDLEALNIKVKNSCINAKVKNGYKVAVYFDNYYKFYNNFHIARENKDGNWSEKVGYTNEVLKFDNPDDSIYVKESGYKLHKILELTKPIIK